MRKVAVLCAWTSAVQRQGSFLTRVALSFKLKGAGEGAKAPLFQNCLVLSKDYRLDLCYWLGDGSSWAEA
jgi:hypothetical protein